MNVHQQYRNKEDWILVWLHPQTEELNDNCLPDLTILRTIVDTINIFTNPDECSDFVTDITSQRVFMIVPDTVSEQTISAIHDMPQVDTIFIFSATGGKQEESVKMYTKVKGVYTQMISISAALKLSINQYDQDSISISFVSSGSSTSTSGLDQPEPSFMCTQILKEILLHMEYDERYKENFIKYVRSQYTDNEYRLKMIGEFANEYRPESSISWYTRDVFFYQVLNRALRTLEFSAVIPMSFFIRDLYCEVQKLHAQQFSDAHETFTIYRGQGLSNLVFEKLKKTKGNLMSFNNFLSTSKDRAVSLEFAEGALVKSDMVGILFKMTIDPSISFTPFAVINNVNYVKDEVEILFTMNSVFRINEIEKIDDNDRLYQVELQLINHSDQQLRVLIDRIKKETYPAIKGWPRMSMLLIKLHHFNEAQGLYEILLHQATDEREKGHLYHMLGILNNNRGNYVEAIEFFENSIKINQMVHSLPQSDLVASYNSIGLLFSQIGEYSKALSSCENALEIEQNILPTNHFDLAASYNNFGMVYMNMGEYSKALPYYEKAMNIRRTILPRNHSDLAVSYNNIGVVYMNMGEYSKALSYYEKAMDIRRKILPPNHPDLAASHNNIGVVYMNMGQYSKALSCYEKTMEIRRNILPANHPDFAASYNNIGVVYMNIGEYSKALSYYEKALEIEQKTLPPNHPHLATSYSNIGLVYDNMGDYSKALSFYKKELEIYVKTLPANNSDLATAYNNIGRIHSKMSDYPEALLYFHQALEIQEKTLPRRHHKLTISYKNIARVYFKMEDFLTALLYYDMVLEIEQSTIPPNSSTLAVAYNDISSAYSEICDYSRALSYCDKALEIEQNTFPLNHPIVITTYNNIGLVYNKMGDYLRALSWLKKAFDTQRAQSSLDDLLIAETYSNMGQVYNSIKDFLNAVSYYKKTLKIQQKVLSNNDLVIAITYNSIGRAHAALENYSDALSYYQNALKIQQKVLSANNPSLAKTYNNIGEMYRLTGDYAAALSYYQKNLEIQEQVLPLNHASLAKNYFDIGQINYSTGNYEAALVCHERVLEIQSISLPPQHPSLVSSHFNIAVVFKSLKRYEEAIRYASRAVLSASRNTVFDQSQVQTYEEELSKFLNTIVSEDEMKTIKSEEWTYPVLLVLSSLQDSRLRSIFSYLTDGHLLTPISIHTCETKLHLNEKIKNIVLEISSVSTDEQHCLLKVFSSMDHIESIYLLGKSLETDHQRNEYFTEFPKVCIFCKDEGQLALRWALDTVEECRTVGDQYIKEGKKDTARVHFQRGMQLFDRLGKLIGSTGQQ